MSAATVDPASLTYSEDGLLPVVVQDIASGAVLMVAWADQDAVEKTLATGDGWFWSRSRREPWCKGATSGNLLRVAEVRADCDADTLLYRVDPAGPACHTGDRTCFDGGAVVATPSQGRAGGSLAGDEVAADRVAGEATPAAPRLELGWLWRVLEGRRAELAADPEGAAESYTARLLRAGVDRVARKVGEEATETVIAALRAADHDAPGTRAALAGEAADLLYHLLVLLMAAGAEPGEVAEELRRRHSAPRAGASPKPENSSRPENPVNSVNPSKPESPS